MGAVALFFHRWGKIRMLLPYQPVFKEEVPAIAAMNVGCSPSPTLHGQQLQHQSSLQSTGSPAVLVSANKFVSLDPAAMRRNQFMVSVWIMTVGLSSSRSVNLKVTRHAIRQGRLNTKGIDTGQKFIKAQAAPF